MYTWEDTDFVNCLRNEKQLGSNIINSAQVQSVIDSIYESAKTKKQEGVTCV